MESALGELLHRIAPHTVLVPFRHDWHPDHLAVHRAATRAREGGRVTGTLVEYFVYTQRRLLPGGDVRRCLSAALPSICTIRMCTIRICTIRICPARPCAIMPSPRGLPPVRSAPDHALRQ